MFDADMQAVLRTLTGQVFGGPDGAALKAELMDENPGRIRVAIHGRYPDLRGGSPVTAAGFDLVAEITGDELHFNAVSRTGAIVDAGIITRRQ